MSEAYLTNWSVGSDWTDRADPFHEQALADARVATEYRRVELETPVASGVIARIRQAFAGRPTADPCTCAA